MKDEIKIVARSKSGEMLKGYAKKKEVEMFSKTGALYLRLAAPDNTVGTMIYQDQLQGLFRVKTFEGNKPGGFTRIYFDLVRWLKKHEAVILASLLMVFLSLVGLIALF